jgi:putative CocE/NonD family hydrolase
VGLVLDLARAAALDHGDAVRLQVDGHGLVVEEVPEAQPREVGIVHEGPDVVVADALGRRRVGRHAVGGDVDAAQLDGRVADQRVDGARLGALDLLGVRPAPRELDADLLLGRQALQRGQLVEARDARLEATVRLRLQLGQGRLRHDDAGVGVFSGLDQLRDAAVHEDGRVRDEDLGHAPCKRMPWHNRGDDGNLPFGWKPSARKAQSRTGQNDVVVAALGSWRLTIVCLVTASAGLTGCLTGEEGGAGPPLGAPFFSKTNVVPGDYQKGGTFSVPLQAGRYDTLPSEVIALTSIQDGARIEIAVVRPATDAPVPVVLMASPYLGDLREATNPASLWRPAAAYEGWLVPHGFAMAYLAVRGTSGSGGCMDWWGTTEQGDLIQAIEWLARQPWSSGEVGMLGTSYEGAAAWSAASAAPPPLRTIVVVDAPVDFDDFVIRNGTAMQGVAPLLAAWQVLWGTRGREQEATSQTCTTTTDILAAGAYSGQTGARDPLGVMQERERRDSISENYTGSVFYVQGFADGAVMPHNSLPWIGSLASDPHRPVKMLLGQWGHSNPDMPDGSIPGIVAATESYGIHPNPTRRWDFAELVVRWFDKTLRGNASVDVGPAVQVADTSLRWRSEEMWPPPDTVPVQFYLASGGLLETRPSATTSSLFLQAEPRWMAAEPDAASVPVAACEGCALFVTSAMEADLRFAGVASLDMPVRATGNGGTILARLAAVQDGERTLLSTGVLDLRFHAGSESTTVMPGQRLTVRLVFEAADAVVPAGARFELALSQGGQGNSDFLYTTFYRPTSPTYPIEVTVGGNATVLGLATFVRPSSAFFDAP